MLYAPLPLCSMARQDIVRRIQFARRSCTPATVLLCCLLFKPAVRSVWIPFWAAHAGVARPATTSASVASTVKLRCLGFMGGRGLGTARRTESFGRLSALMSAFPGGHGEFGPARWTDVRG